MRINFKNKKTIGIILGIGIFSFLLIQGILTDSDQPVSGMVQYVNGVKPVTYTYIHQMTNSVIKADQKWGLVKITKGSIEKVKSSDIYADDSKVKQYIDEWENGNFANSDKFHNYVWGKLGGTIGKARSIDNNKIEEVLKELGFDN